MIFDPWSPQDITEGAAAATIIGGAVLWVIRKLRALHKNVSAIWLFLAGDEENQSLIDRMIKEEFRSRFMMMHARDGIFECDSKGHCTYVNPQLAKMFGLEAAQMLNNGWLLAVQPGDRAYVWDAWCTAIKEQVPYDAVYTLKSGMKVRSQAYTCFGADRKPLYYIGVVWDITRNDEQSILPGVL